MESKGNSWRLFSISHVVYFASEIVNCMCVCVCMSELLFKSGTHSERAREVGCILNLH